MKLTVHHFRMGDVEDPEIYAAQPLHEWEMSEFGSWVMANSKTTPTFHIAADRIYFGYQVKVTAEFEGEALTYFLLKYKDKILQKN